MRNIFFIIYFLSAAALLVGCSDAADDKTAAKNKPATVLPGQDIIVARFNQQEISRYDLDSTITRMLGANRQQLVGEKARKNILESMVLSRVMADASKKNLTDYEKQQIDAEMKAYRDQLLVNIYLKKHAEIKPITPEMVKKYYDDNQVLFGGTTEKYYEMIAGTKKLPAEIRANAVSMLGGAEYAKNWEALTTSINNKFGPIVEYKKGIYRAGLLHPNLDKLIAGLNQGEASKILFVTGKAYVVKVTNIKTRKARPLNEVTEQIEKVLAAQQVKETLASASKNLLKDIKIEYPGQ